MVRPARSTPKAQPQPSTPVVIDERPRERILPRSMEAGKDVAIRTVLYIEVGDVPAKMVQEICVSALRGLDTAHAHYVIPVRHGKLTQDIHFELEFLTLVRHLCEIKDGKIELKKGAEEVDVIRKTI